MSLKTSGKLTGVPRNRLTRRHQGENDGGRTGVLAHCVSDLRCVGTRVEPGECVVELSMRQAPRRGGMCRNAASWNMATTNGCGRPSSMKRGRPVTSRRGSLAYVFASIARKWYQDQDTAPRNSTLLHRPPMPQHGRLLATACKAPLETASAALSHALKLSERQLREARLHPNARLRS